MGGWRLKSENCAFLSNIFLPTVHFMHSWSSKTWIRIRATNSLKSLDPDLNPDPKHYNFSYCFLQGDCAEVLARKKVIILELPTVYRGAITIIKGNESNPPVCKGPTQQRNACLRMVPYLLQCLSSTPFRRTSTRRAAW